MRTCYLVCYDVADPKRLTRVRTTLRGFGAPLQFSVFLCYLTDQRRVQLHGALLAIINTREDRVLIANLGPLDGRGERTVEFIGAPPIQHPTVGPTIV